MVNKLTMYISGLSSMPDGDTCYGEKQSRRPGQNWGQLEGLVWQGC